MPPHVRTNSPHVRTNWSQIWSHKPKRLPPYKRLAELIFMVPLVLNTWLPMISPPYMWTDWWIACRVWGPRLIEQSTPKYRAGPSLKGLPPLTAPYYQAQPESCVVCGMKFIPDLCQIIGRLGLNQCSHPANQTDLSSPA